MNTNSLLVFSFFDKNKCYFWWSWCPRKTIKSWCIFIQASDSWSHKPKNDPIAQDIMNTNDFATRICRLLHVSCNWMPNSVSFLPCDPHPCIPMDLNLIVHLRFLSSAMIRKGWWLLCYFDKLEQNLGYVDHGRF